MASHWLFKDCPVCGKNHGIVLNGNQIRRIADFMKNNKSIQNEFPDLTPEQREFFITGICDDCWNQMKNEK